MLNRLLNNRDGEGVARWIAIPVILAVLALVATSLTFPWAASAQETTTSPTVTTSTSAPSAATSTSANKTTTSATSTTDRTARAGSDSPQSPSRQTAVEQTVGDTTNNVRLERRSGSRAVQPYALNPGIVVSIVNLDRYPIEVGPDESLTIGEEVRVEGKWVAPDDAQGGDEFYIDFPQELELDAESFQLLGADASVWGNCAIDTGANRVTCTLTDTVNNLVDVWGTFEMFSTAVERTTLDTVEFGVNGEVQAVPLPGQGGIGDGVVIGDASKTGRLNPDMQSITWTINIPGSDLSALDPNGTGIVTLTDTLSENMTVYDGSNPTLRAGRGNDMPVVPGGASITPGTGPGRYDIEINNGRAFDPELLYRVAYTTRTTSNEVDQPGARYSNSVNIGGEDVGHGVGQEWTPATTPSKSGSWVGNSRFERINWTLTVPGTVADAGSVTIAEQLGANNPDWTHAVCADGLGLSVTMVDHLPQLGGSTPASADVTTSFDLTGAPTAGATDFTFGLNWNQSAAFDPEKYYRIAYSTCVTGDEVPNSSVTFDNTATVNNEVTDASVDGYDFPRGKSGTFNTGPEVVNGVEQPANTTVTWNLEVPGHDLEGLDDPAVITDTFSDTLAVCEVSDDLKENLDLTVTSRDFHSSNRFESADVTADTTVTHTGNTLTFTLPRPADGYDREIEYDIEYTLCTSSGGVDPRGTSYSNEANWNGQIAGTRVERSSGAGGTGQGVSTGSFTLNKLVAPFSEEFSIEDTVFTVRVEEFAPGVDPATGDADEAYNVEVRADGTPVSGLNVRGAGWQIRLTEVNLPHGNGVYFEPGVFRPAEGVTLNADATQALVTVQAGTNVKIDLVNNAVLGTASVTKNVVDNTGGKLTGNEEFVVEARINTGEAGAGSEIRQISLSDGESYSLGDLPIGTKVTFSEVQPANTDRVTWAVPIIEPKTLTIGQDPAANAVTVTNTANITHGSFSISKKLKGPEAYNSAVPATVPVVATWTDADGTERQKTVTLPTDGTAVAFGENLPGGTRVTLTETLPADGNGLKWTTPAFSGDVETSGGNSAVVVIGEEPGHVKVSNFVSANDGTLQVVKRISGEAAEAIDDDEVFTVQARWQEGGVFRTEVLELTPDLPATLETRLDYGTQVTLSELETPDVENVDWAGLTWGTNPDNADWIAVNGDHATVIVSDDPTEGRLVTLDNQAQWTNGSIGFSKYVFDGEDPVPATEADLPDGAEFQVRIDGINPSLPAGTDFPAVGELITLNEANDWSWDSEEVVPRDTLVTFSEVDPAPLDGMDWARPFYYVAADAGEPEDRNTAQIVAGEHAEVQIRNRPIPMADVDIDKVVTGVKGKQVAEHSSTTFQVTATWTDPDDETRSCILDVRPDGTMTPTVECDAVVIGDRVQFPLDTEITFVETGAKTDVRNVQWGNVSWSVEDGDADLDAIDGEPTGVVVTLTGDPGDQVSLELENETSSRGLIFFPFPIPIPGFGCGCSGGPTGSLGGGSSTGSVDLGSLAGGSLGWLGSVGASGSLGSLGSLGALGSLGTLGSLGAGSNGGPGSQGGSTSAGSDAGSGGSEGPGSGTGSNTGSVPGSSMGSLDSASLGMGFTPGSSGSGGSVGSNAGSAAAGSGLGSAALGSLGSAGSAGLPGTSAGDGSGEGTPGGSGDGTGNDGGGVPPVAPGTGDDGDEPAQPQGPGAMGGQTAPQRPSHGGQTPPVGHNGAPGKPAPAKSDQSGKSGDALAVTGANVLWLGGAALVLLAGGSLLLLRTRRDATDGR